MTHPSRLPKSNGNVKYFENTRYNTLIIKERHKNMLAKMVKYGVKLKILLKILKILPLHNKGLPPEKTLYIAQTIILTNLVFKYKNCYP